MHSGLDFFNFWIILQMLPVIDAGITGNIFMDLREEIWDFSRIFKDLPGFKRRNLGFSKIFKDFQGSSRTIPKITEFY